MPPSQRVTRSAARLGTDHRPLIEASASPPTHKRKFDNSPSHERSTRRPKRSKSQIEVDHHASPAGSDHILKKGPTSATMSSSAGPSSGNSAETSPQQAPRDSSRRKSSRHHKHKEIDGAGSTPTSRKSRRGSRKDQDVIMKDVGDVQDEEGGNVGQSEEPESSRPASNKTPAKEQESSRQLVNEDEYDALDRGEDPFAGSFLSRFGAHAGLSGSLRALTGLVSGTHGRLRNILEQLRTKEDPSVQHIALQDLSELLLVSTEDNLAGHFAPDQFVKELVALMQPNDFTGEENPEIMLLACRCIANMMEALPAATSSVVYGGAVPILCQKLLEIHYIDLAEQALSTLEKISVEFPSSIVREGGLTACLTYLDFFATSTQRTAVTTAANCCRNIPEDSFSTVRDVMPILLNTLSSSDQRVVEQASLCVSRIIDSFKYHEDKLEELVGPELLQAILRLLLPGSTNMISSSIHTQFLRVLAITARSSARLSVELLKMNVVDTLYQILTGVSAPAGTDQVAAKIDKNIIMQSIIRTPREQIFETLNVICEILPAVSQEGLTYLDELQDAGYTGPDAATLSARSKTSRVDKRLELLRGCPEQARRFAVILFPTLMHAYTSTVNLSVRQKVLTAHLKMLSNLDTAVLEEALRGVAYASHLASILSQDDNHTLVTFGLQIAEILLERLEDVYRPQFYREGIIAEITKLADRPIKQSPAEAQDAAQPNLTESKQQASKTLDATVRPPQITGSEVAADDAMEEDDGAVPPGEDEDPRPEEEEDIEPTSHDNGDDDDDHDEDDDEDDEDGHDDDMDASEASGDNSPGSARAIAHLQDIITLRARRFMESNSSATRGEMRDRAADILEGVKVLAGKLQACYSRTGDRDGLVLFQDLAKHFVGDSIQSITSYELKTCGIVDVLLEIFNAKDEEIARAARAAFLEVFMTSLQGTSTPAASDGSFPTAFSALIHKLQEVLSRSEHFEVVTVHHNAFESSRGSPATMLAKQLRLKLIGDEESGIPKHFRNIMVSIHAIATFKALDDYLRPRISLADRPQVPGRTPEEMAGALAAYRAAMAAGGEGGPPPMPPFLPDLLGNSLPTRNSSKPSKDRSNKDGGAAQADPGSAEDSQHRLRRSSRQHAAQTSSDSAAQPSSLSLQDEDLLQQALECADENQISDDDDDDDDADIEAELKAITDDIEDELMDDEPEDPSAVHVEVANSGKVVARTEDGAKVSTPNKDTSAAQIAAAREHLSALARYSAARNFFSTPPPSSSRPMSYASALQQPPTDWHLEFSVNGQPITSDTTIFRACHTNATTSEDSPGRSVWSSTHSINFKRVKGPATATEGNDSLAAGSTATNLAASSTLPPSLSAHPVTSSMLRLMSILHDFNANLEDVLAETQKITQLKAESSSQFINTKLTAKLNRQLEEPLIVASQCLPTWSEDLARLYPFLFPFETRHLFLQSTSFGYSRLMSRWQSSQAENEPQSRRHRDERPFLGRAQRQKVRISRSRILESAIKVMELYGSSSSILEVEYFDEVGTGLGPTLEFYSTVSKEFSKKKTKLWRENESFAKDEFAFGKRGLFPAPMSEEMASNENGQRVLHLFRMLGKFVARSMLDSRIIDVSFNPTFFRIGDGTSTVSPSLGAVATVDQDLAKSLKMLKKYVNAKQRVEEDTSLSVEARARKIAEIRINDMRVNDLGLDFTLPGYPHIELEANGSEIDVTIDNLSTYISKVIQFTLSTGVQRQADAFREGFSQVFPYTALKAFTPAELVMLFGRVNEDWSLETLMDSIKADHGFNLDSKSVQNLLQVMSEFSPQSRRDFLQFVTGSPKLPIGGFKSLTPMFTVVCKPAEPPLVSDDYLPSVMTCVNYLKMPDYSSLSVLREKLATAIVEGQGAFHLS